MGVQRACAAASAALLLLVACTPEPDLKAGAAERLMDLPIGIGLAGYAVSELLIQPPDDDPGSPYAVMFAASRGIYAAPRVKVVLLDDGVERVAIARVDAVLMSGALLARTVELAKEEAGLDLSGGRLLLNATHTHGGGHRFSQPKFLTEFAAGRPDDQLDVLAHACDTYSQEMTDRVARALVSALKEAKEELQPALLGHGFGENKTASRDRRCSDDEAYGAGNVDQRVTVLRVDAADSGKPIAVMFHYAMHGTMYDFQNRNLCSDAPGHAEYAVEQAFDTPVVAMYLQGSAGDVSPSSEGHSESQGMQRVGWDLARTVVQVRETITPKHEAVLKAAERWLPLSHKILGYKEGEFFPDGAVLCQQFVNGCNQPPIDPSEVLCLAMPYEGFGKYYTLVGAARVGDLAIMAVPGEPVAEFQRQLFAASAGEQVDKIVLGYAQEHDGYLHTSDDWLRGGYEPTISFWGWRFGAYLIEQTADLLHELETGTAFKRRPEPVRRPDFKPRAYVPTVPTDSTRAPAIVQDAPSEVRRVSELRIAFWGGDPGLSPPEVTLEKRGEDGNFAPVTLKGWIPVSSLHGAEMATFYSAVPTHKSDPGATAREHRYEVVYEPPRDLPDGTYRLVARGEAMQAGARTSFELPSAQFTLAPAALSSQQAARLEGGSLVVDLTLLYPTQKPVMSTIPGNQTWQVGRFRMTDPRFPAQFVPVAEGGVATKARVRRGDGSEEFEADVEFVASEVAGRRSWEPGDGPGFRLVVPEVRGSWRVEFPAGSLKDAFGNANAQPIVLEAPQG
jgi:hypothetical protein